MPTSDHDALTRIRELFLEAIAERDSTRAREDRIMSHLKDLIDNGKRLAAERSDLIADRDAQRDRADKAEAHAAELQAKIDADDEEARAAKEDLDAEIAKEAGLGKAADGGAPKPAEPSAPVAAPSGATVTPDANGSVKHEAEDGTVTMVPHDGTTPTATDAQGNPVEPQPEAVAEARDAAAAAGVTVAEPAIPTAIG